MLPAARLVDARLREPEYFCALTYAGLMMGYMQERIPERAQEAGGRTSSAVLLAAANDNRPGPTRPNGFELGRAK